MPPCMPTLFSWRKGFHLGIWLLRWMMVVIIMMWRILLTILRLLMLSLPLTLALLLIRPSRLALSPPSGGSHLLQHFRRKWRPLLPKTLIRLLIPLSSPTNGTMNPLSSHAYAHLPILLIPWHTIGPTMPPPPAWSSMNRRSKVHRPISRSRRRIPLEFQCGKAITVTAPCGRVVVRMIDTLNLI